MILFWRIRGGRGLLLGVGAYIVVTSSWSKGTYQYLWWSVVERLKMMLLVIGLEPNGGVFKCRECMKLKTEFGSARVRQSQREGWLVFGD